MNVFIIKNIHYDNVSHFGRPGRSLPTNSLSHKFTSPSTLVKPKG